MCPIRASKVHDSLNPIPTLDQNQLSCIGIAAWKPCFYIVKQDRETFFILLTVLMCVQTDKQTKNDVFIRFKTKSALLFKLNRDKAYSSCGSMWILAYIKHENQPDPPCFHIIDFLSKWLCAAIAADAASTKTWQYCYAVCFCQLYSKKQLLLIDKLVWVPQLINWIKFLQ